MKKRAVSPLIATVILIGFTIVIAISVYNFNLSTYSRIKAETENLIISSALVDFEVKEAYIDTKNHRLRLLIDNKEPKPIESFIIKVTGSSNIDTSTLGKLDSYSRKWFDLNYNPSIGDFKSVSVIPQTFSQAKLVTHSFSSEIIPIVEMQAKPLPPIIQAVVSTSRFYFKSKNELMPSEPKPDNSASGDTFLYNSVWQNRSMNASLGNIKEMQTVIFNSTSTGFGKMTSFITNSLATQSIGAGTWVVHIHGNESANQADASPRACLYVWYTNDTKGPTIAPCTNGVELGAGSSTTQHYNISLTGSAFNLNKGDKIIAELEIRSVTPSSNSQARLTWSSLTEDSYLQSPVTITEADLDFPVFTDFSVNQSQVGLNEYVKFNVSIIDPSSSISYVNGTINGTTYNFTQGSGNEWYYNWRCTTDGIINFTWVGASDTANNWNSTTIQGVSTRCNTSTIGVAVSLSSSLANGINWTINSLPIYNLSANGNNLDGITSYDIQVQSTGGNIDLYIKADSDLTSGIDVIGLGNETFSFNLTNNTVPSINKRFLTKNYTDNLVVSNIPSNTTIYFKFFLNAPAQQAPGTYQNNVSFKAVAFGQLP